MILVNDFQSSETVNIDLSNTQMTHGFGLSLANSLYRLPVTILLNGELGTGKTTLLKALAQGLGIEEPVSSPTFALEQRYSMKKHPGEFLHLDLYRLEEAQAKELLRATEDFEGIRCIEWSNRMPDAHWNGPLMRIVLQEEGDGRRAYVTFEDFPLPSQEQLEAWRKDVLLPENIIAHCEAVAGLCDRLADALLKKGIVVRREVLHRAAQVHDLLRFLDFRPETAHQVYTRTPEELSRWEEIRAQYPMRHEEACAQWLIDHGFPELAHIVAVHGYNASRKSHTTIEQRLLFYADKRAVEDRIVSLEERLEDLNKRYGRGIVTPERDAWNCFCRETEQELFPDGAPA